MDASLTRLILAEQLSRRSPSRLILEIDIGERLAVLVLDDEGAMLNLSANVLD